MDLVGHDWGGGHVARLACTRPELIRSWTIDIAGCFDPEYIWHDRAQVWQTPEAGEAAVARMAAMPLADRVAQFESHTLPALPRPDLASPTFKANPYPFYARLRAEAPVYRFTLRALGKRNGWLVSRYADVLSVLKGYSCIRVGSSIRGAFQPATERPQASDLNSAQRISRGAGTHSRCLPRTTPLRCKSTA